MKPIKRIFIALLVMGMVAPALWSEDAVDRVAVPFSDPGKPGLVKAHLINGGIVVKGYDGKEVIVEAKPRGHVVGKHEDEMDDDGEDEKRDKHAGMMRLKAGGGGLSVEESKNVMEISVPSWKTDIDLTIQVPMNTSLELHAVNNGGIKVENVNGDIEVANVNGGITLSRISGSAVAQTVNGSVTATFNRLDGKKPLSLITLNGDVDITLPATAKVDFKLKIDNHGEIYSDFELKLQNKSEKTVEDKRSHGGRYRVKIDKTVFGSINGGGQEITLKTFNGDILLRKAK
ncbi:MAG: hypothetical protein KJ808_09055 [Acidobacteria bacterium]|nr:hypothetical protein [Acidobacteriota bacterium]MBU4307839.1 hypothetical protein [Acidobacteriota bacterium]MBU4404434.1 hypothetical protein [Acidobacteriota bacterium]MCG2811370.1 hypothetical protein [Candidatus Aminicenantes bacterium]